jgi:hypothetical protein
MFKLTRTLAIGATLAAVTLAGMITVAHAQTTDEPIRHDARRPPTQGQVGEAWHKHPVTSHQETKTAADAALGRVLARERFSIPNGAPDQVPPSVPSQPNRLPSWLFVSLGVLAVLMVGAGLAVLAAGRASRRAPPPAASPTR